MLPGTYWPPALPGMDWRLRGVTILFVHHEGKAGTPRGTSKREDILDTVVRLKEHDDPHHGVRIKMRFPSHTRVSCYSRGTLSGWNR